MDKIRWIDLTHLPIGVLVVFEDDWDIFPEGVVPAGTRACVTSQVYGSFEGPYIGVTPVTPVPGLDLLEWNGEVHVKMTDTEPYDLSPLGLA